MPILCKNLNLLFFCVPKTASTAIAKILVDDYDGQWFPEEPVKSQTRAGKTELLVDRKHATAKQLVDNGIITWSELQSMHTFATTRNPFDWVVSKYTYDRYVYQHGKKRLEKLGYLDHLLPRLKAAATLSFSDYVAQKFDSKQESVYDAWDIPLSDIVMYEELTEGLNRVLYATGAKELTEIPRVNVTPTERQHYRTFYSSSARDVIERSFRKDLDKFGYQF